MTPMNLALETGLDLNLRANLVTGFNLAPTRHLAILRHPSDQTCVDQAFWSYTPTGLKNLAQAPYVLRAESLEDNPFCCKTWAQTTCLIPVTGFYLWQQGAKKKTPFAVRRPDNRPFFLAGLWTTYRISSNQTQLSFALINRCAESWLQPIHSRTPVILSTESIRYWLDPDAPHITKKQILQQPDPVLEVFPVGSRVNDPDINESSLTQPLTAQKFRRGT